MKTKLSLIILLFLVSFVGAQDREIKYSMDFEKFEIQLDSVNTNLLYTYHDVYFLTKYRANKTDSTATAGFKSSGYYCITVIPDTSRLSSCTIGDTDSLHIYIKELNPDSTVVNNDSTIVTTANTGTDFDLDKVYLFNFTLKGAGAGYRIYARRQDDAGAIRLKVWARK